MTGSELRAGIVGFGLAGSVFHAPLVDAVEGLSVAAIVTSDAERQRQARAAYPGATVAAGIEELWGEVDLVVVATPNRTHVPIALAALERELPVVVDKPLAPNTADAERLLAAGGRLTVFQNRRFDGDFLTVEGLVEAGRLGEVLRLESRFERFRPEVSGHSWRELPDPEEGGGLLLDLGAHLVDQACVLLGPPLRVYAEIEARRPNARVEDDAFVALEHPGGVRAHLWMSSTAALPGPRLRVLGLEAAVETLGLDPQEAQLKEGRRPGDPGYGSGGCGRYADASGVRELELEPGAYGRFYEGVRAWLRDGAPAPVDPRDSLTGLRVLEAARQSAATGSVVSL